MKIFGIGTTVVDHVVQLPEYPQRDTKTTITRHHRQIGGPVPTALSTVAHLSKVCHGMFGSNNALQTYLFSRWGDDDAGRFIASGLESRGVDTSLCATAAGWETGFAHVWTESTDATRTLAAFPGKFPALSAADVDQVDIKRQLLASQILHLDGSSPDAALRAAELMRQHDRLIVLDAGSFKPGMDELLPLVDVLIASKLFRISRFGIADIATDDLRSLGPATIVTTSGKQGATCVTDAEEFHEPAIEVNAVDTNGAGDIFSGAILFGLSCQWPWRKRVQFANAIAGQACARYGNSFPDVKSGCPEI